MSDEMPRAKKATALVRFFEKKPGQSLADVVAEFKPLTDTDVDQLYAGISDGTLTY